MMMGAFISLSHMHTIFISYCFISLSDSKYLYNCYNSHFRLPSRVSCMMTKQKNKIRMQIPEIGSPYSCASSVLSGPSAQTPHPTEVLKISLLFSFKAFCQLYFTIKN